jgi:hypothetical protein
MHVDRSSILLCREAGGNLKYLMWAPAWQPEDDVAQIAPDQLKQFKEKFGIGQSTRDSQTKKERCPHLHSPEDRRAQRSHDSGKKGERD